MLTVGKIIQKTSPLSGPHKALEVGPLVASFETGHGSLTPPEPTPSSLPASSEAQSSLVLCPQDSTRSGFRIGFLDLPKLHPRGVFFESLSLGSSKPHAALEGLGTWGL